MRLYVKQKVFSFGDKFNIMDEFGNIKYSVKGEIFSFGKKLHVYDLHGREVIYVSQKLISFMPRYELHIGGGLAATVLKKFSLFSHHFDIQGTDMCLDGNILAHNFNLSNSHGQLIMSLNKRYMTWGDSYEMDIFDPNAELMCIGINLCIDAALHDNNNG